ncbi:MULTISPECIES: type II CAAX endopeptidase family protein [Actinosynnema]|uniref:CPBP family intramembrane glutamic endopeptidase n=1 Tax=Actinosynnema TaxID=40566 RepID=UPI0020A2F677|nr:type II CAAX endopeptidase family protein [Actinosynnema pretiosum]MCP2094741.1 CAAX protease self-immunity [Actinosynnema pretiosum]
MDTVPDQSSGLRGVLARHPISAFFVLSFVLSWLAWTPYVLSRNGVGVWDFAFPEILGTSQLAGVLPGAYLGPLGAAFLCTAAGEGRPGLRRWAGRLTRWNVNWRWYVGVILGVPLVLAVTTFAVAEDRGSLTMPPVMVLVAYLPMLLLQVLTTGLAEEPGWRDYALPHLQPKLGPLLGNVLLGPIWGLWHLPLFFTDWGARDSSTQTIALFVAGATTISFVMTWVFNRTGESLPLAMILHSGVNSYFSLVWPSMVPEDQVAGHGSSGIVILLAGGTATLVLLVVTRGRLGYRRPEAVEGKWEPAQA